MKKVTTLKGGVALSDLKQIHFAQYVAGIRNVSYEKRYEALMHDIGLLSVGEYPDTTIKQSDRPEFASCKLL
jgi:hypothetical protein